jgi:hypothetical protein
MHSSLAYTGWAALMAQLAASVVTLPKAPKM